MDTLLEKEQYILIYRVSYLTLCTALYAIYRKYYILSSLPTFIFLSSINYWRYPTYSWRRTLDIIVVKSSFLIQDIVVYNAEYANLYYCIHMLTLICYISGLYYHDKNTWVSTYCHLSVHVVANIGNIVLYSGAIDSVGFLS